VSSAIRTTKWNSKIYACKDNVLNEYSFVSTTAVSNNNTNAANITNITNSINSANITNVTSNASNTKNYANKSNNNPNDASSKSNGKSENASGDNPGSTCDDRSFYLSLNLTDLASQLNNGAGLGFSYVMSITNKITAVSAATPFTIYFLTFINYFSLAGIYVLINFPIPEQLYGYLTLIYRSVNANIFNLLGIDLTLTPIST